MLSLSSSPPSLKSRSTLLCTLAIGVVLAACSSSSSAPQPREPSTRGARFVLRNAHLPDGTRVDVEVRGNTITAVGDLNAPGVDIDGMWLVPAFIDSHVHLSLFPAAEALNRAGVAGVVDLASPSAAAQAIQNRLFTVHAGPMITAVRGYPTQGWGRGGYGYECDSKEQAVAAVDVLSRRGSTVIKLPLGANGLPVPWAKAVVERAHQRKIKVAVHALGREDSAQAADIDADILAHVPMEPMEERALEVFGKRTVITTLAAFGGSAAAVENLRALRERGALTLYGTDLGNVQYAGIHPDEIELMMAAGMDSAAILDAATAQPAAFWGFEHLGAIAPGKAASFMLLAEDPMADPLAYTRPSHVYIDGVRVR